MKQIIEQVSEYKKLRQKLLVLPDEKNIQPVFRIKGQEIQLSEIANLIKEAEERFDWQHSSELDCLQGAFYALNGKETEISKKAEKSLRSKKDIEEELVEYQRKILINFNRLSEENRKFYSYYQLGTGWFTNSFVLDLIIMLENMDIPYIYTNKHLCFVQKSVNAEDSYQYLLDCIKKDDMALRHSDDPKTKKAIEIFESKKFINIKSISKYGFETFIQLM